MELEAVGDRAVGSQLSAVSQRFRSKCLFSMGNGIQQSNSTELASVVHRLASYHEAAARSAPKPDALRASGLGGEFLWGQL